MTLPTPQSLRESREWNIFLQGELLERSSPCTPSRAFPKVYQGVKRELDSSRYRCCRMRFGTSTQNALPRKLLFRGIVRKSFSNVFCFVNEAYLIKTSQRSVATRTPTRRLFSSPPTPLQKLLGKNGDCIHLIAAASSDFPLASPVTKKENSLDKSAEKGYNGDSACTWVQV